MSSRDMPIVKSTSPSDETNNEARADSLIPLESTGATPDAQQSTVPTGTQSASPGNETDLVSNISTPRHMVKVPLFTWQHVAKAREWAKLSELRTRPILADFNFTFRAVYDSPDTTTSIRIVRLKIPSVQQTVDDLVSIYSEDRNTGVITQFFAFMPEVPDGFLRIMIPVSDSLRPLGFAECQYYQFFKDLALRKKGREWEAADLESIIDFLADYRMRD